MSNIPRLQFTPQGLVIPTQQEVLNGVLADFNQAFGGGLSQNLETPQGQLATSLAAAICDRDNQFAWLLNNLDPAYSDGIMQDAIGNIYFIKRKGQINSTAVCEFIGLAGTTIPKGFIVRDQANNDWVLDEEISILETGRVQGHLTAKGIYPAEANSINVIHQSIIGLDRVTNPLNAVTGVALESRQDFAKRIKKSVAINAQGMPSAVYSNVANLKGVQDCYVIDNPKGIAVQVGTSHYSLKPHSVYVAVVGGNNDEIAQTIWRYSGNGCDFNGNTTVTVTDDTYTDPKPSYEIQFMRPSAVPIYFQVKLKQGAVQGSEELVKSSLVRTFEKGNKNKIGSTLYAVEFVADLVKSLPDEHLLDVKISLNRTAYTDSVEVGIDQYPAISAQNVSVVFV